MSDDARKQLVRNLKAAGSAQRRAAKSRAKAAEQLSDAVHAARDAGMGATEIAEASGIHRVTVYEILRD